MQYDKNENMKHVIRNRNIIHFKENEEISENDIKNNYEKNENKSHHFSNFKNNVQKLTTIESNYFN